MYTVRKGDFVQDALYRLGIRRGPADAPTPLPPGATIGVLGGGQLGRMLGVAARAMGYRLVALDPDPACPTAAVADEIVVGRYDDVAAARRLAAMSDVVTYELEHVGLEAAAAAAAIAPLRPGLRALRATQDRLAERRFIRAIGEYTAPWREVRGVAEAEAAAEALGYPVRIKLPLGGYDGRSQVRVAARGGGRGRGEPRSAATAGAPLLLEREIEFEAELSVVCARDRDGPDAGLPRVAQRPRRGDPGRERRAGPRPPARRVRRGRDRGQPRARRSTSSGILTVELFQLPGGGLMINELAPRVHNSGHWSIEGAGTSQFEQHLRAILGLPLGSVAPTARPRWSTCWGPGRIATPAWPGSKRPSRIRAPTSTSTASAGCSSGARWGT